jgi:hypothetical protein
MWQTYPLALPALPIEYAVDGIGGFVSFPGSGWPMTEDFAVQVRERVFDPAAPDPAPATFGSDQPDPATIRTHNP